MNIVKLRDKAKSRDMATPDLTPRQAEVIGFVLCCWLSGYIPTYREICDEFEFNSLASVARHVERLKHFGYLELTPLGASLMLTDKALELAI